MMSAPGLITVLAAQATNALGAQDTLEYTHMASQFKGKGGRAPTSMPRDTKPKPSHRPSSSGSTGHKAVAPAWSETQWAAALPAVLAALQLDLDASQQQKLAAYMVLLAHWNSTFNLTALRDPQDMLSHHLADCLAVLAPLARHLSGGVPAQLGATAAAETTAAEPRAMLDAAPDIARDATAVRLLDVGSGGGLPGVVLAIARPDVQVTCVDTVGKKAAFIRQVAAELKLPNLRAEHARVEQLNGCYQVITSRAFASVIDFVTLTRDLLAPGGAWMAMKGKQPDEELAALPGDIDVFHVEQLQVPGLDAQRCIVWMRQPKAATLG